MNFQQKQLGKEMATKSFEAVRTKETLHCYDNTTLKSLKKVKFKKHEKMLK